VTPAWWTAADDAELDVIVWALVGAGLAHRECAACRRLGRYCPPMAEAVEAVLDWRRARNLLSRAEHLRALQAAT
jgi:hypothetical protein